MPLVVLNHWGGVPSALHAAVVAAAAEDGLPHVVSGVPLEHSNALAAFERAVLAVGDAHGHGKVVVLGATGTSRRAAKAHVGSVARADAALTHLGVDECGAWDGAAFSGPALDHDVALLADAARRLDADTAMDVLWINLLSCRDVGLVRESGNAATATEDFVVPHALPRDARAPPVPVLNAPLPDTWARDVAERERCRFGVALPRTSAAQHSELVREAKRTLVTLRSHALPVLQHAATTDAVLTATCALALGERGVRDGATPTAACAHTFVCARARAFADPHALYPLRARLAEALGAPTPSAPLAVGTVAWPLVRVDCRVDEHSYALLGLADHDFEWVHVDGDETRDVTKLVAHLRTQLQTHWRACARFSRVAPPSEPPHSAPPQLQPPPLPAPPPLPPPSLTIARDQPQRRVAPTKSPPSRVSRVRVKETRLNTMHR